MKNLRKKIAIATIASISVVNLPAPISHAVELDQLSSNSQIVASDMKYVPMQIKIPNIDSKTINSILPFITVGLSGLIAVIIYLTNNSGSSYKPNKTVTPTPTPEDKQENNNETNNIMTENEKLQDKHNQYFINELNRYRASKGLPPLEYDPEISQSAYRHSKWMHESGQYIHSTNFEYGENIYRIKGTKNLTNYDLAMNVWKKSPGHNANLLSTSATKFGIGHYIIGDWVYATYQFH